MKEEKGFFEKAFDDMKESGKKQHEIDKENFEAIKNKNKEDFEKLKAENKAKWEEAKKVDPDFQEFLDAKGIKEKAKVVADHIVRDSKKHAEEDREKREKMLEEKRNKNLNN